VEEGGTEGEGKLANPGLPEKWHLKWRRKRRTGTDAMF